MTRRARPFALSLALSLAVTGCAANTPRPTAATAPKTIADIIAPNTTATPAAATKTTIHDIRMWHAPQRSRIVFDMNAPADFEVFTLPTPPRLVVDIARANIVSNLPPPTATGKFIHRIRAGTPRATVTRLVFDLARPVRYRVSQLSPNQLYQHRLVVDFHPHQAPAPAAATATTAAVKQPKPRKSRSKALILIDPGHGGEDPGALGKRTHEKIVVLAIARKLAANLNRRRGLQAELTRRGDYYIPLRERIRIAHQRGADLFVSIHADAFHDAKVRGASVYALSQSGASSESAKRLANRENASDLIGGASLAGRDQGVAEVMLGLSLDWTVNESLRFGREVVGELAKVARMRSTRVEQAGFVVLKSQGIPSILVETAYITNPTEEKLLLRGRHQERIAAAVATGIERYLRAAGGRHARR